MIYVKINLRKYLLSGKSNGSTSSSSLHLKSKHPERVEVNVEHEEEFVSFIVT